jgi:hypothetical protein
MNDANGQNEQQEGQAQYQAAQPQRSMRPSWWSDFVNFRRLLMFSLIKYVYILGALGVTGFGLKTMFTQASFFRVFGGFWAGLAILIVGNLVWRLVSEGIIVLFRIAESVSSIDTKTR